MTPVFNPKHFRRPRITLYSPPPSHTWKFLAVRILPSPGSRRSMTSPNETASYLHSALLFSFRSIVPPLCTYLFHERNCFFCHFLNFFKFAGFDQIRFHHPASATCSNCITSKIFSQIFGVYPARWHKFQPNIRRCKRFNSGNSAELSRREKLHDFQPSLYCLRNLRRSDTPRKYRYLLF